MSLQPAVRDSRAIDAITDLLGAVSIAAETSKTVADLQARKREAIAQRAAAAQRQQELTVALDNSREFRFQICVDSLEPFNVQGLYVDPEAVQYVKMLKRSLAFNKIEYTDNVLPLCARLTEQCERVYDACVWLCALTTTALRSMLSQAKMMRDSTRRKPLHCKGVFLHVTDEASADYTNMMLFSEWCVKGKCVGYVELTTQNMHLLLVPSSVADKMEMHTGQNAIEKPTFDCPEHYIML
eukprot:17883-Heterococcus_DN1.PRE.2